MPKGPWDRRAFIDLALRTPLLLSAAASGLACRKAAPAASGAGPRAYVRRAVYLLFPYPELGDAPYESAAEAVASLAAGRADLEALVAEGTKQLDGAEEGSWLRLDEAGQIARLQAIETSPFFTWLYQVAIDQLYNDERVWAHVGYEGSSFEKGGYIGRGFDDIDWL